jgi:hypothetical protein
MHGADWNKMRAKYAQFLPELSSRADLNRLIQWLCSELASATIAAAAATSSPTPNRCRAACWARTMK